MNARLGLPLLLSLLLVAGSASGVMAQRAGDWTLNPQYSTVLPIGEATTDFADGFSFRGGTIDLERGATDLVAIGLSIGWHVIEERNEGTSVFADGALGGSALRYVNAVPLLLTGSITLGSGDRPQPWIGVGGGTAWIENRTESGPFVVENTNWHTAVVGEVGLRIPRDRGATITVSARYNRAFETNGIEREYVTFSIGTLLGG